MAICTIYPDVSKRNKGLSNLKSFKVYFILILVLLVSGKSWGQLYWNTNGTGATLTSANWGLSGSSSFTTAWTNSSNIFFTANSAITNVTNIPVGNLTISNSAIVTLTAAGSFSTGGAIRIFDIGLGSTLIWNGQNFSTTAGTGITKNGAGTWNIGTVSTGFSGALTLNAGTITFTGNNGLGSGSLNINGGILTPGSSGNRSPASSGVTIGGDFQLGDAANVSAGTGNLTFTQAIALGSSTRTITIGGNGTYTFSGIISTTGSAGLTVNLANSATGSLVLSGVNTYSGNTTINGSTLTLSGSGSIANSPIISIGSGATFNVSGLTTALALGTGQTLKASGTGSNTTGTITVASGKGITLSSGSLAFTGYGGGATAPLTVNGASAGALALNSAPVTVTTTTALTAGTYTLIGQAGSATGVSGTPGTLTINGSGLASGTTGALSVVSGQLILSVTSTPDILLADNGTQIAAGNTNQGTSAVVLQKIQLGVSSASAFLTGMTCTTTGTYAAADITNLKVRYSVDNALDAGDATLSTYTNPGVAGAKTFPSFTSQAIASGATGYIFITADIAAGATHNNTIGLNAIATTDLTFASGNKSGTTTAGGTQTIKDVTAPTVSTYSPANASTSIAVASNLVLTFAENIQKGTGNITIKKYSDNTTIQTIDITSTDVTVSGTTCTINPPADLAIGVKYYVVIDATAIQDLAGNAYSGIATNATWSFTTIVPTVSNVSSSTTNGTYKSGDAINVSITFTDNVTVTGTPQIQLETGTVDEYATYTSGSGTNILNFTYTVVTGDASTDLDYKATSSLGLNNGTINSSDGIAATLTLPALAGASSIAGQKAIVIDAVTPTVSTYSPTDGNTAVTINQNLVLTFTETVKAGTAGTIDIYNSAGLFESIPYNDSRITFSTNTVTINPTSTFVYGGNYYVQISATAITDNAGNAYAGIATTTTWNFTTVAPSVTNVTSTNTDGTYKVGDVITVNVTFNDIVNVGLNNGSNYPYILLNMGASNRQAAYTSGTGTSTLNFAYTIQNTDASSDLDYATTTSLALNGSNTINSADGIAVTRTLSSPGTATSLGYNKAIVVDALAPTVSTYSPTNTGTNVSIASNLVLTFSENIQKGTGNITIKKYSDNSTIQTIDVNSADVTISSSTLTINPPSDLVIGVKYYILIDATAIKDIIGNSYAGISVNSTWNFTTIAPTVTNVTSTSADGTYKVGDVVNVVITFTDNVTVTGTPRIQLETGTTDEYATYSSGSGSNVLNFSYTVVTGDVTSDLDYKATNSLGLNSGTINSADGIAATLTLPTLAGANSIAGQKAIVIDGVLPTLSTLSPTDGNTTVSINQNLIITFSENVKAGTTGNVIIYKGDGTVFETIPYNDSRITFSTNTATINPSGTFAYSTDYYVQLSATAISDIVGNAFAGISTTTTWNFTTVCGDASIPYIQDFESVTAPGIPSCTSIENAGTGNNWITSTNPGSGFTSNTLEYDWNTSNAANAWYYTQGLSFTAGVSYRLTFKYGCADGTYPEKLKVKYGTSASNASMTTLLYDNSNVTNITPNTQVVDFTPSVSGVYYLGFNAYSAKNMYALYVDDISVTLTPTCFAPTITTPSFNATTATITWTAATPAPANGYQYEVRTSGSAGSGATGLATSGNTATGILSADITGLTDNTVYSIYVRSICSVSDNSEWSSVYNFTTSSVSAPTTLAATAVTSTNFIVNWNAVSGAANGYLLDVSTSATFTGSASATLTESFESGMPGTYNSGTYALGSGSWSLVNGGKSTNSAYNHSSSAGGCQLQGGSSASATSPSLNTVGTVTFWGIRGTNATSITVQKIISGVTTDIQTIALTTTIAQYTVIVNDNSPSVQIKFLNGAQVAYIDDISIGYTGITPSFVSGYSAKPISGQSTVTASVNTGLSANTTYYYRVRAAGTNSTSTNSNVVPVTTLVSYTIAASSNDVIKGSVTGAASYDAGATVSLTALPASGSYRFVNWTENGSFVSRANTYTFTASINRTLFANFESFSPIISGTTNATTLTNCPTCDVTVASGGSLTIDEAKTFHTVTVAVGGKLTLASGSSLTAPLTLQSSASGTATYVDNNPGTGLPTVSATVEQWLTSGRNWYVSMPITAANVEALSTAASVVWWNEPIGAWSTVNASTAINPLIGYISVGTTGTQAISFNGTLNNGDMTVSLSRTPGKTKEGFNLVGNPYPSYLNPCGVINSSTKMEKTIWYRTKSANTYYFETVNTSGGAGTNNSGNGAVTGYVPPMQAFWVRVLPNSNPTVDNSETLTFTNAMRSHEIGTNRLKAPAVNDNKLLRLRVSNGTNSDETLLYFNTNASNGLDAYDSRKMTNASSTIPEIYTTVGSDELVINGMNSYNPETEIPLGFRPGQATDFSIRAAELSNFDSSVRVILKDAHNISETDITETPYTFSTTDATAITNRFSILFRSAGTTTGTPTENNAKNIVVTTNALQQIVVVGDMDITNESSVLVHNAVGQKLTQQRITSTRTILDQHYVPGVYMVTVLGNGKTITRKVTVY